MAYSHAWRLGTTRGRQVRAACIALGLLSVGAVTCAPSSPGFPVESEHDRVQILELESETFGNSRFLRVRLPPGYEAEENRDRRYPVLYLNDGQNLFDAEAAIFSASEWRVDETVAELERLHRIEPIVVVGIDNAGRRGRAREYLPYPDESLVPPEPDPQGSRYDEFLAGEVIPFVEQRFRVRRGREGRALGGSSYGALVAVHVAISRPDLFSGLLLESPSFYVDDDHVLRDAAAADLHLDRVYLGVGTNELALPECPEHPDNAEAVAGVRRMAAILEAAGLDYDRLKVVVEDCAVHGEAAWAKRLPAALEFLYRLRRDGSASATGEVRRSSH